MGRAKAERAYGEDRDAYGLRGGLTDSVDVVEEGCRAWKGIGALLTLGMGEAVRRGGVGVESRIVEAECGEPAEKEGAQRRPLIGGAAVDAVERKRAGDTTTSSVSKHLRGGGVFCEVEATGLSTNGSKQRVGRSDARAERCSTGHCFGMGAGSEA
ncbi:hypothetical protein B0H17DRAFT_1140446 [Mycena rosella]|uniref:Uncharacterized protein n=1 Tax=Mycena rosella TaxID=1033263 RepID=A0AAD7D2G2_MYCRO|nr:hypothetical protein B0H17DRAFT_1140446 [Mycena rosella]